MSLRDSNPSNPTQPKRVAIVLASPAISSTTGWPVGFWWSELTHPYYAFTEAGYAVELFSTAGGKCVADGLSDPRDTSGYSASDLISMGFLHTPSLAALVEDTKPVSQLSVARFDAIVVAGGQAPMFSFEGATALHEKFVAVLRGRQGRGRALPRRRAAALRATLERRAPREGQDRHRLRERRGRLRRRRRLGHGRAAEGSTPDAVAHRGRAREARRELRASSGLWRGFAVRDGNLITGQQNFSGAETADLVIEALGR
jgi:putative intracellular protease/amidase